MLTGILLYDTSIEPPNKMIRRLSEPIRWITTLMILLLPRFGQALQQCTAQRNYRHLVVLVHGYLGSDREQEYLGEALQKESTKLADGYSNRDDMTCQKNNRHELVILNSKANVKVSTDGVAMGGKRLAEEISEWIEQQTIEIQQSKSSTIMTFSMIGNSLGGLYGRYALSELDFFRHNNHSILPLVFCTTSSPHIGVSQETFIELPRWIEPHVATVFQQQTMDDLFGVHDSTIVKDMCLEENENFLFPLKQFQKRIAVANAYKTDFLVSVSSGAFLSLDSDSVHHYQDGNSSSTRLMKDTGHVALQVVTETAEATGTSTDSRDDTDDSRSIGPSLKLPPAARHVHSTQGDTSLKSCVDSLDRLGWHKIFIDTRNILPGFMSREIPKLEPRATYTSKELKKHFETYGTLLPIAHPLNMANSKTDLYRLMTQGGQPIMDALAELLMLDMVELSEKQHAP